jgi:hypothetical protein
MQKFFNRTLMIFIIGLCGLWLYLLSEERAVPVVSDAEAAILAKKTQEILAAPNGTLIVIDKWLSDSSVIVAIFRHAQDPYRLIHVCSLPVLSKPTDMSGADIARGTQRIVPPDDAAYKGLLIDCGRRILLGQKAQQ